MIDKVTSGEKLPIAESPEKVYSVMLKCWEKVPKVRPLMETIYEELSDINGVAIRNDFVVPIHDGNTDIYHN